MNLRTGCELLQKVYLCSNTNNLQFFEDWNKCVVNCFKKCIFAVIQTTVLYSPIVNRVL